MSGMFIFSLCGGYGETDLHFQGEGEAAAAVNTTRTATVAEGEDHLTVDPNQIRGRPVEPAAL